MTCLGERLTALVDGELDHDERDRALAHLAGCPRCRQEADTMRRLKGRLRALGDRPGTPDAPDADFLGRLRALADQIDPPQGPRFPDRDPLAVSRLSAYPPPPARRAPRDNRPSARGQGAAAAAVRRRMPRRYLAVGAAAVVLGFGSASYLVGGENEQQPAVVPAFDKLEVEHSLTNGVLPMTERSPAPAVP